MRNTVFFHADDYGVSKSQSLSILECFNKGVLNSVSVLPNSPKCDACFEMIKPLYDQRKMRCVVHLNFVEGMCMAEPSKVPLLTDGNGRLNCTFGSVLKMNYAGNRSVAKEQFKLEIAAQIAKISDLCGSKQISVDAHQHFHMIPVVFEALMEVIKEGGYQLEYLRISLDPLSILFKTPSVWGKLKIINLVKWSVLKFLCPSKKKLKETGARIPVFFGIFYTCEMKLDVVEKLLPKYKKYAQRRNKELELMFHPGAVYEKQELLDENNEELVEFYASKNREDEKKALMTLS